MPRSTSASSSTSSSVSVTGRGERGGGAPAGDAGGVYQDRERAGQQPHLEGRDAGDLTIELHGPRTSSEGLHADRATAREPQAPGLPAGAVRAARQLPERQNAFDRSVGIEGEHVQPAVVGGDVVAQAQKW